jgi:hypothetical protein
VKPHLAVRWTGPLDGIRVLDLSSVVMGPLATQSLGDLGADVITVGSRDGDINRVMSPGPHPGLSGVSLNLLRNKRNISLDIAHPDGGDPAADSVLGDPGSRATTGAAGRTTYPRGAGRGRPDRGGDNPAS